MQEINIIKNIEEFKNLRNTKFQINGNTAFDIAFDWAMYNETGGSYNGKPEGPNGYSNHANDTGGLTYYGIAQNTNKDVDVTKLTLKSAKDRYKTKYWDYIKGDQLDPNVAMFLFDFGCGSGIGTAVMHLQEDLGLLPDGKVGPKTINAVHQFIQENGVNVLLNRLAHRRISRYNRKIKRIPSNDMFLIGWSSRTYFILFRNNERKEFFNKYKDQIKLLDVPTDTREEYFK